MASRVGFFGDGERVDCSWIVKHHHWDIQMENLTCAKQSECVAYLMRHRMRRMRNEIAWSASFPALLVQIFLPTIFGQLLLKDPVDLQVKGLEYMKCVLELQGRGRCLTRVFP